MRYELPQTLKNFLYLYTLYKRRAILFLGKWTPPTILNLGSWKLACTPTHMVGRYIRFVFGISPRVPELGPKMWSKLGTKCHNSASNCLIELKFGVWRYFSFILPPLSMGLCCKVKKCGPNWEQNAITQLPIVWLSWNLGCGDIFHLYYHLLVWVYAVKSKAYEIWIAPDT